MGCINMSSDPSLLRMHVLVNLKRERDLILQTFPKDENLSLFHGRRDWTLVINKPKYTINKKGKSKH